MRVLATSSVRILSPRLALAVLGILGALANPWGPQNARSQETLSQETLSQRSDPTEKLSLWTRTKGKDWPRMLGVHYDSKNTETGILTQWPKDGLRIVGHEKIGTGNGKGVAGLGRWPQCELQGKV